MGRRMDGGWVVRRFLQVEEEAVVVVVMVMYLVAKEAKEAT
jgi:hypothetical protein